MKKTFALSLILFSLMLFWGCQKPTEKKESTESNTEQAEGAKKKQKEEEALVPVEIASITRGMIESTIRATTNLEAEAQVKVYARTSNPVVQLLAEEGDLVEKDQILLVLENETQKITVAKAESSLEKSQKDFTRKKELFEQELITTKEYTDAEYDLRQAKLNLAEAKQNLEYTEIMAPISGTITKRMINLGDQVNVNQHLFDIVDFNTLVARVYLPENNLAKLAGGQVARINSQAMGGKQFSGEIIRIAPTVDAKTGTFKVTVSVNGENKLRPGMYVDVELVLAVHEDALLIPKQALVYDSDQTFIFTLGEDGTVHRQLFRPVLTDKFNVLPDPEMGLSEGDKIVIAGQTGLKDNAKVRVLNTSNDGRGGEKAESKPDSSKEASESEVQTP